MVNSQSFLIIPLHIPSQFCSVPAPHALLDFQGRKQNVPKTLLDHGQLFLKLTNALSSHCKAKGPHLLEIRVF